MVKTEKKVTINANIKKVKVPPGDCLVITQNTSFGKNASEASFQAMAPNQYDIVDMNLQTIAFAIVRKSLFKQITEEEFKQFIEEFVLPHASEGEIYDVAIETIIEYTGIEIQSKK